MKIFWPNHWKIWKDDFSLIHIGYHYDDNYDDFDVYYHNFIIIIFGIGINFAFKDRNQTNAKSN